MSTPFQNITPIVEGDDFTSNSGGQLAALRNPNQKTHAANTATTQDIQDQAQNGRTKTTNPKLTQITRKLTSDLGELNTYLSQIRKGIETSGPLVDEKEFQIGVVRLSIPPEKVEIREIPQNMEVPGLRTDGSTIIKSGKGRIQITLSLVFNGRSDINNNFRKILAQFRSFPYVPVISPYLARIVQPKLQKNIPTELADSLDAQIELTLQRIVQRINDIEAGLFSAFDANIVSLIKNKDEVVAARQRFSNSVFADTLQEIDAALDNLVEVLGRNAAAIDRGRLRYNPRLLNIEAKLADALDETKLEIIHLQQLRQARVQAEVGGVIESGTSVVPCVLDQLTYQSEPGRSDLIRAQLTMSFFNTAPYGGTLRYKDLLGQPTIDPNAAVFFQNHLSKNWLKGPDSAGRIPTVGSAFTRSKPVKGLAKVVNSKRDQIITMTYAIPTFKQLDPNEKIERIKNPLTISDVLDDAGPTTEELVLGGNDSTVRYVSVAFGNRLAFQPIPGEVYPSAQYIGANPGRISIVVDTTDKDFIAKLHRMKRANQQMSTLGIRQWRRTEIHIRNPFINMGGTWTVQLDDVTTESVSAQLTRMTIQLFEHSVEIEDREAIFRNTLFSIDSIYDALKYLFEKARPWGDTARLTDRGIIKDKYDVQAMVRRLNVVRAAMNQPALDPKAFVQHDIDQTSERLLWSKVAYDTLFGVRDPEAERLDPNGGRKIRDAVITKDIIRKALFLDEGFESDPLGSRKEKEFAATRYLLSERHLPAGHALDFKFLLNGRDPVGNEKARSKTLADLIYSRYKGVSSKTPIRKRNEDFTRPRFGETHADLRGDQLFVPQNVRMIAPEDDELRLLAEYLSRSSGNSGDEVTFDETKGSIKITRASGEDATEDISSVLTLFRAIMNNTVVPPEGLSIQESILGNGHTFQDFLREQGQRGSNRLYPDLDLPTYKDMLEPLLQTFLRVRAGNGEDFTTFESVKEFTQRERLVINNFIPTYRQAGQIPPVETSHEDLAYDLIDTVLPDYVFWSTTTETLAKRGDRGASVILSDSAFERQRNSSSGELEGRAIHDPLRAAVLTKAFTSQPGETPLLDNKVSPGKVAPLGATLNTDFFITEAYEPARARANFTDFGKDTRSLARDIYQAAANQREDNQLSLRRCFPTIRMFFIEEDQEEGIWKAVDDVYGFNSIVEAHITRHKYQPDLAEITLTNLQGNLEYDKFSTAWRDTPEGPITNSVKGEGGKTARMNTNPAAAKGPIEPETNERVLRKFPLNEGTRIVIQLGYHSKTDYMKTVFTGKIAEVTQGDLVKIVAQGYLAELLYPMTSSISSESSFSVIKAAMESPTVAHFGKWTPLSSRMFTTTQHQNGRDTSAATLFDSRFASYLADPKLKNVHVANYSGWWSKTLLQFVEDNWDVGDGSKTAWDVIQEIVSYSPGYIAAVVPYDLEATLFVGRPEQVYTFTDGLRQQERSFIKGRAREADRSASIATPVIDRFLVSNEYRGPDQSLPVRNNISGLSVDNQELLNRIARFPFWTLIGEEYIRQSRFAGGLLVVNNNGVAEQRSPEKIREHFDIISKQRGGAALANILDQTGEGAYSAVIDLLSNALMGASLQDSPRRDEQQASEAFLNKFRQVQHAPSATAALSSVVNTVRQSLKTLQDPTAFFSEIWNGTTVTSQKITRAIDIRLSIWNFDRTKKAEIVKFLFDHRSSIPNFLVKLDDYLQNDPLAAVRAKFQLRNRNRYPFNPRNKPFRDYHIVTSLDDLIENQIATTRSAMWNGVGIGSGSDRPLILWADDGIAKQDRILRYFNEPNADIDFLSLTSDNAPSGLVNNKYLVGVTRLAQGMRRMYRGQLLLRGRPEIKPWDVVHVYDHYNQISGPVEVERVTHHFTAQTGLVTTITPHALVVPNNHIDSSVAMAHGIATGIMYSGLVVGAAVAGTLLVGLLTGGVGFAALAAGIGTGVGANTMVDFLLQETTDTDITGNLVGVGRHGGLRMPIKIIPLSRQGMPWVGALRGFGIGEKDNYGFVLEGINRRFQRSIEDAGIGAQRRLRRYTQAFETVFEEETSRETKARNLRR